MPRVNAVEVKCPFYISHGEQKITCEKLGSNKNERTFKTQEKRVDYMSKYCNDLKGCEQCPMYKDLSRKYGEW